MSTVIDKHVVGPIVGTYRVRFRLAETGYYSHLESSIVVYAVSRQHAVASTPGGQGAEVLVWGPRDTDREGLPQQIERYDHDCDLCTWLGQYESYDLWWCEGEGEQGCVIARRSSDGPDYLSTTMPETTVRCTPLHEGWERVRVIQSNRIGRLA